MSAVRLDMRAARLMWSATTVILLILPPAALARGQATSGSISGLITDSSGAVVPGVTVSDLSLANFGSITNTIGNPRIMQFAARVLF